MEDWTLCEHKQCVGRASARRNPAQRPGRQTRRERHRPSDGGPRPALRAIDRCVVDVEKGDRGKKGEKGDGFI